MAIPDSQSAESLLAQLEALEIPPNIDPKLLEIWLRREHEKIEHRNIKYVTPPTKFGRKLSLMFSAYIGIGVMCLSIVLGLVQGKEPNAILQTTCVVFLVYTIAGFFVGIIAEYCVTDSVETLLREIVRRTQYVPPSDETGGNENIEPQN
ncbi:hypothetical protein FACS189443_1030 [Planctomycetales bacterium]|nr:hypothetical protein FACS189443_1030 [Planctomycetales bacterium]